MKKINKKEAGVAGAVGLLLFGAAYYFMVYKPKNDAEKAAGTPGNGPPGIKPPSGSGSSSGETITTGGGFMGPIIPSWWYAMSTPAPTTDASTGFYIGQKLKATNLTNAYKTPSPSASNIGFTTSIGDEIGTYAGTTGPFIKVTARVGLAGWFGADTYYIMKSDNPIAA